MKKIPYKRYNVKKLLAHPFILKADIDFTEEIFEDESRLIFEEDNDWIIFKEKLKNEDSTGLSSTNHWSKSTNKNTEYNEKVREIYEKLKKKSKDYWKQKEQGDEKKNSFQ